MNETNKLCDCGNPINQTKFMKITDKIIKSKGKEDSRKVIYVCEDCYESDPKNIIIDKFI